MERDTELRLIDQCLELVRARTPYETDPERRVPVREYTDQARFALERQVLFQESLCLVAHGSQLAGPGEFVTRDFMGVPIVIARGEDGIARAFLNVCRHRGATVELRAEGRCKRFVCPYHAWTYGLDGALVSVRHKHGFPGIEMGEDAGLVQLPCHEAAGFVWVCPTPRPSVDPPARLDDAETRTLLSEFEALGSHRSVVFATERRVWNANWKLLVDGGLESYHFRIAHRNTVGPRFADNISTFEMLGDHVRTVLPRASIAKLCDRPREEWTIRGCTHLVYTVFPTATVLVQEGHLELITMTPIAVDKTLIELATLVPDPGPDGHSEKAQGFWAANHAFTKQTLHEDFEMAEHIQRGIHTGANEHFRFATFEGALSQWHDRMDAKLAAATKTG